MTVIELPFPISVNAMYADGSTRRIKSQKYCDWILEAGYRLNRQRPSSIKGPVTIKYELQEVEDRWLRDCFNFEKGVTDLLVSHKIIEADHRKILRGGEVWWNPDVSGVRITISPVGENRVSESHTESAHERSSNRA